MVTLCVQDQHDSSWPLFPKVKNAKKSPVKKASREFFISREKNLSLSLVLLLGGYAAVLFPALLPKEQTIWKNENSVLLNRSATLLSRSCRPGWCRLQLRPMTLSKVPVFLRDGCAVGDLPLPLGFSGSEEAVARVLRMLPQASLPAVLESRACRRCVVVGSGGVLLDSYLGAHIDQHDVIIRMNDAPVYGFERDSGSRTTIRLMYPEGAPHSAREYYKTSIVALVAFKSLDLDWFLSLVTREPLSWWSKLWFWRNVIESIPLPAERLQILNPEILHQTSRILEKYAEKPRKMVPTLGACAVVTALQLCDEVSLAGFGYDLQHPDAPLHYYESLRTHAMQGQVMHDITSEKAFLRELVRAKAVNDLTGALY